ncbi:MAG TPA: YtxH domain-containing protein [Vicinamibacterales bacterium]|nr:YtxH domain-containing protein [Vicinamibacterales bacterium]
MDDRTRVLLSAVAGAVLGAIAGYLYFTDRGKELMSRLEPRLDSAMQEMGHLRETVTKAQAVASEGWKSISQIKGSMREGKGGDWGGTQSSPF